RYLAAYSRHGVERKFFWSISRRAGDPLEWNEERVIETPGHDAPNFRGNNVTYANPFCLSAETNRLYLFYRGFAYEPNYRFSDNGGANWTYGGHWLIGRGGYAPYVKYACNSVDTIHFVATEDHPRNFDNSLYHGFIRRGQVHFSDGKLAGPLTVGTNCS